MRINLCQVIEKSGDIDFTIDLYGTLTTGHKWKFDVSITYSIQDSPFSIGLPFKTFNQVRLYLTSDVQLESIGSKLQIENQQDGSITFRYKSVSFNWSREMIDVIKRPNLIEKFASTVRKCNHPFDGEHRENILVWKDEPQISENEIKKLDEFKFPIDTFKSSNNDEYSLSLLARTNSSQERWFTKLELRLSIDNGTDSRPSADLQLSAFDFLAMRDFFIHHKKDKSYFRTFFSPSGNLTITFEEDELLPDNESMTYLESGGKKLLLYPDFIDYVLKGEYSPKLTHVLHELNHELYPQQILRWWFNHGYFFLDKIDKLGNLI